MGRLRGSNGTWLVDDGAKVGGLVRDVFGVPGADPATWVGRDWKWPSLTIRGR